jgi:Lipocalin-like domain
MKSLKSLLSLTLLGSFLFFASCDKEEDPTPRDLVIGNWTVSKITATITVGGQSLVAYFKSLGLSDADAQEYADEFEDSFQDTASGKIEFKADGTYKSSDSSGGDVSTGKWELSADGKTLTTDKGTADETVLNVSTLTATKMNLNAIIEDEDVGADTFTINLVMELTK